MTSIPFNNVGMHTTSATPTLNHSNLMMLAQNLRTGNLILDMVLMSLASGLIAFFMNNISINNFKRIWNFIISILKWLFKPKKKPEKKPEKQIYKVLIRYEYKAQKNSNTILSDDTYIIDNKVMFESIFKFLSEHPGDMHHGELAIKFHGYHDYEYSRYRSYSAMIKPLLDVTIDGFTIKLIEQIEQESSSNEGEEVEEQLENGKVKKVKKSDKECHRTFKKQIIISSHKDIPEIIEFVNKIYQGYIDENFPVPVKVVKQEERFYYIKNGWYDHFKRWPLESRVNFNHIFFPGKEKMLRRIDQFINRDKQVANKMEPSCNLSKFTILLHGPPGGGKTSFIKALHNYTNSHVIALKLSQFDSIKDLMRVFHDKIIECNECQNDVNPVIRKYKVPVKNRIYLFEDIDAADKIVLQRKKKNDEELKIDKTTKLIKKKEAKKRIQNKKKITREIKKLERQKNFFEMNLMKLENDLEMDDSTKKFKIMELQTNIENTDEQISELEDDIESDDDSNAKSDSENEKDDSFDIYGEFGGTKNRRATWIDSKYSLKLADILNLLDGVLELSGCFVVLTTNYKEKLDDALTRPGRITYDIRLGEIKRKEMLEMIEKFIPQYQDELNQSITFEQVNGIQNIVEDKKDYLLNNKKLFDEAKDDDKLPNIEETKIKFWLEYFLQYFENNPIMPCRFETFCQNEDNIWEVIINMDEYITYEKEEKLRKSKVKQELQKLNQQMMEEIIC